MKKEFSPLVLFFAAVVVFGLLSAFGIVYNLIKSLYECCQVKFWRGPVYFVKYWLRVAYQVWNVIKYLLMKMAIAVDLFGNVTGGELVEDCVTAAEQTLYGDGNFTVSAATGELELRKQLNRNGMRFTNMLSAVLGANHSIEAYQSDAYENTQR